ncbi:MAG: AAA family ATPase, partial [Gammaproteobacteria bacterium]|nr:AAA family ATPase [Gammaproteobacteria bacterium]
MYEAFYGFKEKPFSMLPDPGFLYLSKKHQAALTLLEYGLLNHVGFCVISGEAGAGKTTILRALLERLEDNITVGLITNTHQSFGGLLDWVLSAFDLHRPNLTHVEMHQIFMEYLIEEYANGRTVLLIIDEAQNMKPDVLEELRMLSNVNSEKDQLMQVVLAGQPALKETLRLPDLMQFAQRIAVDYHLESLSLKETCGYIQHRLVTAGAEKDVFTPAACERIHNYSGGTPRLINLLCETVLVYGFADQQDLIDVDLVDEMVLERMKDSVVPIVNRDIAKQDNAAASKELEKDFPWIKAKDDTERVDQHEDIISPDTGLDEMQPAIKESVKPDVVAAAVMGKQEKPVEKSVVNEPSPQAAQPAVAHRDVDAATPFRKVGSERTGIVDSDDTRKQLIKFGSIAAVLAVVLIVFALLLGDEDLDATDAAKDKAVDAALQQQREKEEKKLRQLQIEAETLKKERDAAIARAEEERLAKLKAEKRAAAQTAAVEKEAAEKRRLEEKKQIEAAKQRERRAKQAEAKAREEVKRARRQAAKLEEQRRVMQIRLDEE